MDKILEKLGVYDLASVLFSGVIIMSLTLKIAPFFNEKLIVEVGNSLQFLVMSYFVGMVFQEIGSLMSDKELLKSVFIESEDERLSLTKDESIYIKSTVGKKKESAIESDVFTIYNYCKMDYLKTLSNVELDRKKSIAGMARNLFCYFIVLLIASVFKFTYTFETKYIYFTIISIILSGLFYRRYNRFTKMRYVNILRTFYYTKMSKDTLECKTEKKVKSKRA